MRKLLLIIVLILLFQLLWVSAAAAAPPESGGFWHRVRYGETLYSIGRGYGVSPYAICSLNGLRNCNYIKGGQVLWIPERLAPHPRYCDTYHRVTRGQTLYSIGRTYDLDPWVIARANQITNLNRIYAGQRLCIP